MEVFLGLVIDLYDFLKKRNKYWLNLEFLPLFNQSSNVAPFIYSIF